METDFLVVGAGVAGLMAAIEAAQAGRVLVLTKDRLTESASEYAQGGIAVAISDDDQVSLHEQDTIKAGNGLCDHDAVRILVEQGPREIQRLIDWGVEFDREGARLAFTQEGAHSRRRVLHAHGCLSLLGWAERRVVPEKHTPNGRRSRQRHRALRYGTAGEQPAISPVPEALQPP